MMELSDQEKDIFRIIQQLVPYEEIRISKDKLGKPNCYLVVRTQKIVLSQEKSEAIAVERA